MNLFTALCDLLLIAALVLLLATYPQAIYFLLALALILAPFVVRNLRRLR